MKPRHQVSRAAIELIKRFEGYRSKAARLPDGRWTIGYGHTLTAREGAAVSLADAEALLIYDLLAIAQAINERVFTPLTQNQFDALCAFAFNIGLKNFNRSSVLRRLNEGALLQAACAMELWRKADFEGERIVIDALVRRRAAEKTLFLTPTAGFIPVPTPLLPPNLDLDANGSVPRVAPTAVKAPMDGAVASLERDESAPEAAPDGQPSAMQAAAAAVSARLATIFPDEEEELSEAAPAPSEPAIKPEPAPVPAPEAELQPEPQPAPEPAFTLLPPVADETPAASEPAPDLAGEPQPGLFDTLAEAANDTAPPPSAPEGDFPRTLASEPEPEVLADVEEPAPKFNYLPLVGLTLLGALIFAGGILWAVSAQGAAGGDWAFGWLAALVGIVVLGRAAYLFLERLGQIGGGLDHDDLNGK